MDAPRIVALPLFGIGDVLMTTPALRNIAERTGAKITYLHMFKTTRDVLEGNPHVEQNIHFPFLSSSRLASLRFLLSHRGRYDKSINFYPSNRRDYTLAAFIIGCSERIGHRYHMKDLLELNFLKNRTLMEDDSLHNVQENLRLLSFLGINDPRPYPMEIYLTNEERQEAKSWIKERRIEGKKLIGLHPGTSSFKNQYKRRWPSEKFAQMIREASSSYPDTAFILFGGPEENELKEEIRQAAGGATFTADLPSIRSSMALIGECSYFIANDSGLMHAAATMQVPTVGIFGPTNPAYVHPWGVRHRIVRHKGCGPCFRYSPKPLECEMDGEFPCVHNIGINDVLDALASLMQETTT